MSTNSNITRNTIWIQGSEIAPLVQRQATHCLNLTNTRVKYVILCCQLASHWIGGSSYSFGDSLVIPGHSKLWIDWVISDPVGGGCHDDEGGGWDWRGWLSRASVSGLAAAFRMLFSCSSCEFFSISSLICSFRTSTSSLTAYIKWLFTKSWNQSDTY